MPAPALAVLTRARRYALAFGVTTLLFATACDEPLTQVQDSPSIAPDQPLGLLYNSSTPSQCGPDESRTFTVQVTAGKKMAAGNASVALFYEDGLRCYATTSSDGVATFTGVNDGDRVFGVVRDLIPSTMLRWTTAPPLDFSLDAEPSIADKFMAPSLFYGSKKCASHTYTSTTQVLENWDNGCVIKGGNPSVKVELSEARTVDVTVLGLSESASALVSALDPYIGSEIGWFQDADGNFIGGNWKSEAFLQSADRTNSPVTLPVVGQPTLEAIWHEGPLTDGECLAPDCRIVFGSGVVDASSNTVLIEPGAGICKEYRYPDEDNGDADPALDFYQGFYGFAMSPGSQPSTLDNDRSETTLVPSNNDRAVVELEAFWDGVSDVTGTFTMRYSFPGSEANNKIDVDFGILAGQCFVNGGAIGGAYVGNDLCLEIDQTSDLYKFVFAVDFGEEVSDASFIVKAPNEGLSTSREGFEAAAIDIPLLTEDDLTDGQCIHDNSSFDTSLLRIG